MVACSGNWRAVQGCLYLICFLFGILGLGRSSLVTRMSAGFGLDYVSYILILLSIWIMALVVGRRQKVLDSNKSPYEFLLVNLILLLSLILTFSCVDYILFYFCFERTVIPTFILILGWGYQPERVQAGIYVLFYTLFGSLPLLVSLLRMSERRGRRVFSLVVCPSAESPVYYIWYFCSIFAFLVKLPMFIVHLWLPKAHVEAPVAGSMILAGVLLKLGGYGLYRICPLFIRASLDFVRLWLSLGLVGGTFVSLVCLRQSDMKSLIAYSSVAHMGLVLCGLITLNTWGLSGAVRVIVGHGLCSSGLFCLANISYERLGRRSLLINKGLLNFIPRLGLWWFLLSIGNMAAPPSLSLLGEIRLILSVVSWSNLSVIFVGSLSFLSAAYTLYLYSVSQHGKITSSLFSCCSGTIREYLVLILHWLPLNVLILKRCVVVVCLNSL